MCLQNGIRVVFISDVDDLTLINELASKYYSIALAPFYFVKVQKYLQLVAQKQKKTVSL